MLKSTMFAVLLLVSFARAGFPAISLNKTMTEDAVVIQDLNLKIAKIKDWRLASNPDYHLLVAFQSNPTGTLLTSSIITLAAGPLNVWSGDAKIMEQNTVVQAAMKLKQRDLIAIGGPETVRVAGVDATAKHYLFTIEKQTFIYETIAFQKDRLGFLITFWGKKDASQKEYELFKAWVRSGITAIDPAQKVSEKLIQQLEENDAALFGLNKTPKTKT
jgi:hypothetical protein